MGRVMGRPAEFEFSTCQARQNGLRIQYSLAVLEQIRLAVVEGFYALPRGGIEVGGVLYGTRDNGMVRIAAFRSLDCEHAMGPAFVLSEKDEAALQRLLQASLSDRALNGFQPVGWYHSHTRSEIFLTGEDLAVHDRYFPEPWQVALVLRPYKADLTRAAFFIREPDGGLRPDSSYYEFTLEPVTAARRREEAPPPSPPPEAPSRVAEPRLAPRAAVPQPAPPALQPVATTPQFTFQATGGPLVPAQPTAAPPQPRLASTPVVLPPLARREHKPAFDWGWIVAALLAVFIAVGVAARPYFHVEKVDAFQLRAIDQDGQLLITWDRAAPPILMALKGSLDVLDGTRRVHFELDRDRLRNGSFTYGRQAERVDVRMQVQRGAGSAEEVLTFLGRPKPEPPPMPADQAEAVRQRDEALREIEQLQRTVQSQASRIKELEQAQRILRQRMAIEGSGRRPRQ